jgi:8-oxo-dGTP diphosphatase
MASDGELAARLPRLFAQQRWEWGGLDARFSTHPPADELVTNVHVVGFVGQRIVLCRDERDFWFLPGGTREPAESIDDCVARELVEEAGARVTSPLQWLGAHHCVSDRAEPYRPHQPHPKGAWLWCTADMELFSAPTMPEDGEQVVEVRAVEAAEAQRLLVATEDWYPDLVSLALSAR